MKKRKLSQKDRWKILNDFLIREPKMIRLNGKSCLPPHECESYNRGQLDILHFIKYELLTGNTVELPSGGYDV